MRQFFVDAVTRLDFLCWFLVVLFFSGSALVFDGNFLASSGAAMGVVAVMMVIGISIEVIIESLKGVKGLGTITGFITNGPELVCLVAGLAAGDILFAASTPLGSNFINPVLLAGAALVSRTFCTTFQANWKYTLTCIPLTAGYAVIFYLLPEKFFCGWTILGGVLTVALFFKRPSEAGQEAQEASKSIPGWMIFPASILLIVAGWLLDPVVSYASLQSCAPKGVIGFFVLATLSSWPEFKCCLALLRRHQHLAAILNISVSNITNIWLAIAGVAAYLVMN